MLCRCGLSLIWFSIEAPHSSSLLWICMLQQVRVYATLKYNEIETLIFLYNLYLYLDYRYGDYNGMMESGTTAMELITAVIDGPLCFLVVFAAAHDFPWRHPVQIILCTMQLYGLVWFTLQPIYSDTGLAGHFSSDPVSYACVKFLP